MISSIVGAIISWLFSFLQAGHQKKVVEKAIVTMNQGGVLATHQAEQTDVQIQADRQQNQAASDRVASLGPDARGHGGSLLEQSAAAQRSVDAANNQLPRA